MTQNKQQGKLLTYWLNLMTQFIRNTETNYFQDPRKWTKSNLYAISIWQWSRWNVSIEQLVDKINNWQRLYESSRWHIWTIHNFVKKQHKTPQIHNAGTCPQPTGMHHLCNSQIDNRRWNEENNHDGCYKMLIKESWKISYQYSETVPSGLAEYSDRIHANFPIPHRATAFSPDQGNKTNVPQESSYKQSTLHELKNYQTNVRLLTCIEHK